MKPSIWILLLGLWAVAPGMSQSADWYLDKPISDIRFDGLVTVQRSDIDGVTRPYIGKKFSDALFQDLQTSLYNLDFFDGLIVPTAIPANDARSEVILLFKVTEKPTVETIDFVGNDKVKNGDLQGTLTVKRGDLINQTKVSADEKALVQYYRDHGFADAEVTSSTEPLDAKKVRVVFQVREGVQNAVKTLVFTGNAFASESTLRGLIETKPQSFFDSGVFKEDTFSTDLRKIEAYYWNHGYLDARVSDVQRNLVFDTASGRNTLNLVISINEGKPLRFGGFVFDGNQIFSSETLQALVRQPVGKTANKERVEADYQRVVDLYLENGYIFNSITREENRDADLITYKIVIVERPRAHIENIIVKGNDKTKDKVVLRELPVEVGDVFNKTKIVSGIRNLYNLQYFNSINPETPQGSAEGLMDLVLNVEEGKTADISFGLAFSGTSDFPISATVKWSDRNFLGNGQTVGVDSSLSPANQSLNLTFTENWFLDQRMTLGGQLGFTHAVNTKIDQDLLGRTYDDKEIPDPYRDDEYVFSSAKTFAGHDYQAGELFPGVPTADQVAQYDLITRYQYDLDNGTVKKNAQMQYDSWQISAGVNTGYSWYTPWGRFGLGTGEKSVWQLVTYDDSIYRPMNQSVRNNLDRWQLSNQWWNKATYDTRDLVYNPSNGFLASETVTFGGGFLGGNTHFTRFDTRVENYWKFVSWPLAETYSLDLVLKLRAATSFLLPSLGGPSELVVQPVDQLYIDGMLSGRGWGYQTNGKSTFTSGAEIRTPVPFVGQLLWIDTFIDHAVLVNIASQYESPFEVPLRSQRFAWGTGIRIVSPQFPLALYFTKPFLLDNQGKVTWAAGDGIFGEDIDMKLVVAFGMEF